MILVTGAGGLVGSATVKYYCDRGHKVIGIDNDTRKKLFGTSVSNQIIYNEKLPQYSHFHIDIRDSSSIESIFKQYGSQLFGVVHCAAQPSHDWAAKDPVMDFTINANGTLNLLESYRNHAPKTAAFVFLSTNKVYGDNPNNVKLIEKEKRYEPLVKDFLVNENMSVDHCTHSLFGVSKLAADAMVQEYGKYFGLNTVCFRGGCLTGPNHSGAELHGFLSYLVKCVVHEKKYFIYGHKGKQVRDNIHTDDLVTAIDNYIKCPSGTGVVYNIGGGKYSNISMLEAIEYIEDKTNKKLDYVQMADARVGDHIWYVSDISKFKKDYPDWKITKSIYETIDDIIACEVQK
tara:strand:- start:1085 stop:2122 length:1038 start_codon:yes stop_codon:yes gene_type:complete